MTETKEDQRYMTMYDIPGVSDDEIRAVEDLKTKRSSFIFGTIPSTESFIGINGEIQGFTALLCEWLTELFGIPFRPEMYEWSDLLSGLESDDIDFTGVLAPTGNRNKAYIMTDAIAGHSVQYIRLDGSISLATISELRVPCFGLLRDSTTFDQVRMHLGYDATYVLVDGYEQAYELLKSGEIDAFIDRGIAAAAFDVYGDVVTEDFYPLIYGPVSLSTHNTENTPIITVVKKALRNNGIRYLTELYDRGAFDYKKNTLDLSLTQREREYISNNPVVSFAAEYDNYPASFYNSRENAWQGVCFDVLDEVAALTGLEFRQVSEEHLEWDALMQMLETGEASIISELIRIPEREGRFLWPDTRMFSNYYALLSKSEHSNISLNEVWGVSVGIVGSTAQARLFMSLFPNHSDTVIFSNFDAAFDALMRGDVEMVMASQNQLLILTNYQELAGYKANLVFDNALESTLGFNKDKAILRDIVEKALRLIDTEGIADNWTNRTFDYRERLVEAQHPLLIGMIILLVCLVLVMILLVVLLSKSLKTERLAMAAEIREQVLVADNDMLDRLNHMKMEFFQNMSHDFKTPLTVISTSVLNVLDMLDFDIDVGEMKTSLGSAQREIMRMARMVDSAMKQSSLYDNRKDMEPLDIAPLVRDGAETHRVLLSRHGNTMSLSIPESLPYVYGNADMLLHVVSNLIANANRYTRNGEIVVSGETIAGNGQSGAQAVKVTVSDNGEGVKREILPLIFERGISDGGTGLGLSICKTAIDVHNGTIDIDSEVGKGTTVWFTLPVCKK